MKKIKITFFTNACLMLLSVLHSYAQLNCIWDNSDWQSDCLAEAEAYDNDANSSLEGSFFINDGYLYYGPVANELCSAHRLDCIDMCSVYECDWENVIAASASTLTSEITFSDEIKDQYGLAISSSNSVESAEIGKWYAQGTYAYQTGISRIDDANATGFTSGIFDDFHYFNFRQTGHNATEWLQTNQLTSFAPNGNMLEEKNLFGIYSAQKIGYGNNLVYLTAANAQYGSVIFESFEYEYGTDACDKLLCFEEMGTDEHLLASDNAHSGSNSLQLTFSGSSDLFSSGTANVTLCDLKLRTDQEKTEGVSVKFWMKNGNGLSVKLHDESSNGANFDHNHYTNITETDDHQLFDDILFEEIARTGEWSLYEATIKPEDWINSYITGDGIMELKITVTDFSYQLALVFDKPINAYGTNDIYVDDIRVQPAGAQMLCYVYDPDEYKLLASFDDQHFGLYYQYNEEGQLIRKQKETVRGIKTLMETQYNIPAENRE
jgi:hypothetical protein